MKIQTAVVVDDSKSARFALRKALESRQIRVQALEDASSCYALLQTEKPDVVFLDHVMPGISGFDALRHLRADPDTANVPVVLCSSHDTEEFIAEARALGATDVLTKPPSAAQLEDVLQHIEQAARAAAAAEAKPAIGQRVFAALRDTLSVTPRRESTADLGAQIEALRAQAARLQDSLTPAAGDTQALLQQLLQRMDALERKVDVRLNELQMLLDAGLRQQSERLLRVAEAARSAAVESAHVEAEQTALQAAGQISDQFVSSLIAALRAGSFKPLLPSMTGKASPPETAARPPA